MRVSSFTRPNLLEGGIIRSLICFSIPIIISFAFQQIYNAADAIIIGHLLGEKSLAAVGACVSIFELIVAFGAFFGNGLSLVAARAYGSGDSEKLKDVVASSLVISAGVIAIVSLVSGFFLMDMLRFLHTPEDIIEEAHSYIFVIGVFSGIMFAYNLFSGFLRSIGNSIMPLVFLVISSVLNVIFDILFITKFNMGIQGTAFATVLAQAISALLCLVYIFICAPILVPGLRNFKFDKDLCMDLMGQGLSMGFMSAIVSSGSVILQSGINSLGTMIIAGHVSARKVFTVLLVPLFSFSTAAATFVSQNFGAGKFSRIKRGVKGAVLICSAWVVILLGFMPFYVRPVIKLISGSDNSELLGYAVRYICFAEPFYLVLGILIVLRNSLQGIGLKILPLISSIIELLGKIAFTLVIIPWLGAWGVIICEPLIWCAMTLQLLYVYERRVRRFPTEDAGSSSRLTRQN